MRCDRPSLCHPVTCPLWLHEKVPPAAASASCVNPAVPAHACDTSRRISGQAVRIKPKVHAGALISLLNSYYMKIPFSIVYVRAAHAYCNKNKRRVNIIIAIE